MEYTLTELLTRDDMLRILNERQLKIPGLEILPLDDLERIYKTFVIPLAKREPMSNRKTLHNNAIEENRIEVTSHTRETPQEAFFQLQQTPNIGAMQESTRTSYIHQEQAYSAVAMELESVTALKNIPPPAQLPLCRKRRPHPITEEYLSKATKRIKIAWT